MNWKAIVAWGLFLAGTGLFAGGTSCANNCAQGQISWVCQVRDECPCENLGEVNGCTVYRCCPGYIFRAPGEDEYGHNYAYESDETSMCILYACGQVIYQCSSTWAVHTDVGVGGC
jgi:hypothetical protein